MRSNLHVYQSGIVHESRLKRHCEALWEGEVFQKIAYIGCAAEPREEKFGSDFRAFLIQKPDTRKGSLWKKISATKEWSRAANRKAVSIGADCISCHSLPALPTCVRAKKALGSRLVYEPHELETETTVSHGIRKWLAKRLEKRLIGYCDSVITVCDSIADWYRDAYAIERPAVVRNTPKEYPNISADLKNNYLREAFQIPETALLFIYQGYLSRGRRVDQYLRVFKRLNPEFHHIVFMGMGTLEGEVLDASRSHSNIHFQSAVAPEEVIQYTRCADVGLCGVENICLSYYYSLPNKIFEYLAAGIPCLVPDFPEMRRVLTETGCGWLHEEEDEGLERTIIGISSSVLSERAQAAIAARNRFNWANESRHLISTYQETMGIPVASN